MMHVLHIFVVAYALCRVSTCSTLFDYNYIHAYTSHNIRNFQPNDLHASQDFVTLYSADNSNTYPPPTLALRLRVSLCIMIIIRQ